MSKIDNIENRISKTWEFDKISISHNVIDYKNFSKTKSRNNLDLVRLHFGEADRSMG